MRYHVTLAGRTLVVEPGSGQVEIGGERIEVELERVPGTGVYSLLMGGSSYRLGAARRGGRGGGAPGTGESHWDIHLRGRRLSVEVVDQRTRAVREMTGGSAGDGGPPPIRAPMPGLVVKVEVRAGDSVREGQGLVIVEAMKMENELRAEAEARVKAVHVEEGQPVEKDEILVEFALPEEGKEET